MQTAKTLFDAGQLDAAIQELTQALKNRPADVSLRTFLFELFCFQGALDRAARQLDVLGTQSDDSGVQLAIQTYRMLLTAEEQRRQVFHGAALPKFITTPSPFIDRYVLLVKKLDNAAAEDAATLLDDAEESLLALSGQRNGGAFTSFRDADDRTAGVLEVFFEGEYLWVPLDHVASLQVTPPRRLRELIWAQAKLELAGQPPGDVFLPTRYPETYLNPDDQVRLARTTEWRALHDRIVIGSGQRVFLVDDEEVALLDLGSVVFAPAESAQPR
jgi:type VI secretion system protein ImpE